MYQIFSIVILVRTLLSRKNIAPEEQTIHRNCFDNRKQLRRSDLFE